MNKFIKQFNLNPVMAVMMESFIYSLADKMIPGYCGGMWEDSKVGDILIVAIPGKDTEQVTLQNMLSGSRITTDHHTASAAFTALAVNWFWHRNVDRLTDEQNDIFYDWYHGMRNASADDTTINHDDYFSFTD